MKKTQHTKKYKQLLAELKKARKAADYTQLEVATYLHKHPPFISKIENGERRIDILELAEICNLYGVKVADILERVGIK